MWTVYDQKTVLIAKALEVESLKKKLLKSMESAGRERTAYGISPGERCRRRNRESLPDAVADARNHPSPIAIGVAAGSQVVRSTDCSTVYLSSFFGAGKVRSNLSSPLSERNSENGSCPRS